MQALGLTATWPVPNVSAAALVVPRTGDATRVHTIGDPHRQYRLASIAKPITSWAVLVAVEEGLLALDTPIDRAGRLPMRVRITSLLEAFFGASTPFLRGTTVFTRSRAGRKTSSTRLASERLIPASL